MEKGCLAIPQEVGGGLPEMVVCGRIPVQDGRARRAGRVDLVSLVCLVSLVSLVFLVSFVQPTNQTDQINQINKRNKPTCAGGSGIRIGQ